MKLIIPVLSLERGGTRYIYQIANEMVDKGHEVEIVIPEDGFIAWPLRTKVTRVRELNAQSIPSGDFILPNFWPTVFPAWEGRKGQVVRLSLGFEPLWVKEKDQALATYHLDLPIISISQWHRQIILQEIGKDSFVLPGGVDPKTFYPRSKRSLITGRPNIAYILRSKEHGYTWKGSEDFWEAIQEARRVFPHFDLFVVAPEGASPKVSIPYETVIAHEDTEMAAFYGQADIFISTSYFEAFAMPPLEAMACGTAVITTDNGGNRDYTRNGKNCLVVPPSDISQLTEAILKLLTQQELRQELAHKGWEFAQNWTWRQRADQLESYLYGLLQR